MISALSGTYLDPESGREQTLENVTNLWRKPAARTWSWNN
jgi:hypothetical protein